jgi:hypothetical protein
MSVDAVVDGAGPFDPDQPSQAVVAIGDRLAGLGGTRPGNSGRRQQQAGVMTTVEHLHPLSMRLQEDMENETSQIIQQGQNYFG